MCPVDKKCQLHGDAQEGTRVQLLSYSILVSYNHSHFNHPSLIKVLLSSQKVIID